MVNSFAIYRVWQNIRFRVFAIDYKAGVYGKYEGFMFLPYHYGVNCMANIKNTIICHRQRK